MQEALQFSVLWIEVYTVIILVTQLYDGNCADHMHVISCDYPVCTKVLLKIDVFKNILCTWPHIRGQVSNCRPFRLALQGTFPQTFRKWSTAKQITNEPSPYFIKIPFKQPIIFLSTFVSGF
jgi:hypothetical protein